MTDLNRNKSLENKTDLFITRDRFTLLQWGECSNTDAGTAIKQPIVSDYDAAAHVMSNYAPYATAAAVTAGVLGTAYCAYHIYSNRTRIPSVWRQVGTLDKIYSYPIKSCGPINMDSAECSLLGLRDGWLRDRFLMIINEKSNFITARAYPELLLVEPTVRSSILTLKHRDMEPVHVNLAEVIAMQKPKTAQVWGVEVPVLDCGWEVSEWLSRLLDRSSTMFRLVYYASQDSRPLRPNTNKIYNFTKDDSGALPDETPYNLVNDASVDELNTRLEADCQVTHRAFRPNFLLKGGIAYEEDKWKFVKIGDHVFEILKPCGRCIMTTIDPETGVRNAKTEPLKTLKTYRQVEDPEARKTSGDSPRMGIQLVLRSPPGGTVALNDPVYVA